jgi:hypothetical protein
MARILLSAIVTEIRGKIGGTVFQAGQGGFQAKRLVTPRDPQIHAQITNRNNFLAGINQWGTLTSTEMGSWNGAPDPGLSPYTTFVRKNAIMRYFGQSPFTTNPGTLTAATMDLRDTVVSSTQFLLTGRAPFESLPSGQMMAVKVSRVVSPGKGAFSPSEFATIAQFTGPIDFLTSPQDIFTAYVAKFGPLRTGRQVQFRTIQMILATANTTLSSHGSFIIT